MREPRYDWDGNLAFDGHYAYQYDAWNRLVQATRMMIYVKFTKGGRPRLDHAFPMP